MKEAMDLSLPFQTKKVISLTLFNRNLKFGGTPMSKNGSEAAYIVIYCS
jgi:hypothetical protein